MPPTPARAPRAGAVNPPYSPGKGIPRPSKKLLNLCRASAPGSRACCPRVHSPRAPSRERGQQGGGGGPRKVSGTGPAAREPSAGSCAPARPGSAPGRAAYQQNETRGDRRADTPGSSEPTSPAARPPLRTGLQPQPLRPARARGASCSPGAPPPARAPSPAQGRFAAVINKEGRQAHPSKSCCCMRPSQPPRNVLFKTRLTNMRNLPCAVHRHPPPPPRARAGFLEQAASRRERERASKREREREREALADLLQKHKITPLRCAGPVAGGWILPCSAVPFRGALPTVTRRGWGRRGKDAPETRSSWGRRGRAGGAHPSGVVAKEVAGAVGSLAPHPGRGRSARWT